MPFPQRSMTSTGSPARPGAVSSSAPPSFRVKKKKPGEANPAPNNQGRMTGPPMQKGPGQDSMFANGQPQGAVPRTPNYPSGGPGPSRGAGQPQFMAPSTPSYPRMGPGHQGSGGQAQGMHPRGVPTATHMMADGGFGAPSAIGDEPDQAPDMDDAAGGPQGAPGEMPMIRPEAVAYHDGHQDCNGCAYNSAGHCSVLQMQIDPDGGCNAWEAKSADMGVEGPPPGTGAAGGPMSDSGNPPLS